jgi:O-antigen ligase
MTRARILICRFGANAASLNYILCLFNKAVLGAYGAWHRENRHRFSYQLAQHSLGNIVAHLMMLQQRAELRLL